MSDVIARLLAEETTAPDTWAGTADVTSADAGTTPDGRRLIGVRWNGADLTCCYLASYTPVVGHRVSFLKDGASFLVLGNPALA